MTVQHFAQLLEGQHQTEDELRKVAETIDHCGDYGTCYWDPQSGSVFWCAGDADGDDGTTPFDEIKQRFLAVAGVKKVNIECEGGEPEGWREIEYDRDGAALRRRERDS